MEVINAGIDEDQTKHVLERLDKDVLSKNPRMVIILLGANDYLDEVPLQKTKENLDEMIDRIQAKGAMVVLAEIGASILGDKIQKQYDQIVLKRHVAFVPRIFEGIYFNPSLKSDALHPNDKGYEIIAERILRVVKPLLKRAPQSQSRVNNSR